jgi:hypothetical protein
LPGTRQRKHESRQNYEKNFKNTSFFNDKFIFLVCRNLALKKEEDTRKFDAEEHGKKVLQTVF